MNTIKPITKAIVKAHLFQEIASASQETVELAINELKLHNKPVNRPPKQQPSFQSETMQPFTFSKHLRL